MLVGGSATDPIAHLHDRLPLVRATARASTTSTSLKLVGDKAYLQSAVQIDGWVGNMFVRGNKAYMTRRSSTPRARRTTDRSERAALRSSTSPTRSSRSIAPSRTPKKGWGWLLGVEGDRALVTSGWGGDGLDIYKLSTGATRIRPVRAHARGWWPFVDGAAGQQLFLASGYWGVQTINLQ